MIWISVLAVTYPPSRMRPMFCETPRVSTPGSAKGLRNRGPFAFPMTCACLSLNEDGGPIRSSVVQSLPPSRLVALMART